MRSSSFLNDPTVISYFKAIFGTALIPIILAFWLVTGCSSDKYSGVWDYKIDFEEEEATGVLRINQHGSKYKIRIISYDWGTFDFSEIDIAEGKLAVENNRFDLELGFDGDRFLGSFKNRNGSFPMLAARQSNEMVTIDRTDIPFLLSDKDLPPSDLNIDHAGIIRDWDREAFRRGARIYNSNCINCHGTPEITGSIPLSHKFWESPFKAGGDPYSMYLTLSRGFSAMPPQVTLTAKEKYDVILYVQENFIRKSNEDEFVPATPGYLASLPKGTSRGPDAQPYQPWSDMDYGNFFINTYELVDEETGPERYHSPGPVPYADEDYSKNNFAYKGIAIRLDEGQGGVSKGKAWMIFDHDLMRVAGGWTGEGFIDWDGILLNDKHETYPRTVGKLHFETPVGPGWANPQTGSFDDPRFTARDGRKFGPLPRSWADYKGLYHNGEHIIISYRVGNANVLERLGMEEVEDQVLFTRTINVDQANSALKMRIAPETSRVAIKGSGANLSVQDGYHLVKFDRSVKANVKIYIGAQEVKNISELVDDTPGPELLGQYTSGGPAHYPQIINSIVTPGLEDGLFVVDRLTPPFDNPWKCRMKLSGIDFMKDPNKAVLCATDGDIWLVEGLTSSKGVLKWQRIGAGLFQPLGVKVVDEKIYVICRDQIVRLQDFNGDNETDFYESFNHDHQVSDHFHEFAMGLQADASGNLYYAKSGRHAREALIPQHGTLLKVSSDGSRTETIATGFRAANGVCINPDGSFIVTDQQGFWNPMNRINWIEGTGRFYGNMWGYDPPKDTTRAAMEPPMVWVDMEFDRSPSELLWVDSEKWGPLNGHLLSLSYGFGKIQLVLHERVNGMMQGGVIDLPGVKFLTGVMRGRFNPADGHLYACGMSAWGTTQMMRGGGLYRLRYTNKPLTLPVGLQVWESGVELNFAEPLDPSRAQRQSSFEVRSWDIVRSSRYGSDRYNVQTKKLNGIHLLPDGKSVMIKIYEMEPVDVMTISYDLVDLKGNTLKGTLQNTIHKLRKDQNL